MRLLRVRRGAALSNQTTRLLENIFLARALKLRGVPVALGSEAVVGHF